MYTPPEFRKDDPAELRRIIREARLSTLVTGNTGRHIATPLPLILDEIEGENGVLHASKANQHRSTQILGEAVFIFERPMHM